MRKSNMLTLAIALLSFLYFVGARDYDIGETGIISCDDPIVLGNVQNLQLIEFKREGRVIHSVDIIRGKIYPSQQNVRFMSHVSLVRNSSVPFLEITNLSKADHARYSCDVELRDLTRIVVHQTLNVRHAAPAPMLQCEDTEVSGTRLTMAWDTSSRLHQLQCRCVSMGGYPAPTLAWYRDHVAITGHQLTRTLSMSAQAPLNGTLYTCKADQGNTPAHTHTASTSLKVFIEPPILAPTTTSTTASTASTPSSTSTTWRPEVTENTEIKSLSAEVKSQPDETLVNPVVVVCCVLAVLVFLSGLLVCVYRRKNISTSSSSAKTEIDESYSGYKRTFQCQTSRIDDSSNHKHTYNTEASLMEHLTPKGSPSPQGSMSSYTSPTASMSTYHSYQCDVDNFDMMTPPAPLNSPV